MLTSPPDFFRRAQTLKESGSSFIIATVVRVRGSASAKTGSKALFDDRGTNLFGYIGGGCAESHVAQEACEALREKKPRIVEIDLDDEVFGLMPCGGVMDVYLEPHFSSPDVPIPDFGPWHAAGSQILRELGFHGVKASETVFPLQDWRGLFLALAAALARWKGYELRPLRDTKGTGPNPQPRLQQKPEAILVFGQTRITEELGRILQFLDWSAQVYRPTPLPDAQPHLQVCELPIDTDDLIIPKGAWVIVASHHKQDAAIAEVALKRGAAYVALVASEKRSHLIVSELEERHVLRAELQHFFAPAGLNIPTDTPLQIAFSILCEILYLQG